MLVKNDFDRLADAVKVQFYQRLIGGLVDESKRTMPFILGMVANIIKGWRSQKESFEGIDADMISKLDSLISEISHKSNELQSAVERLSSLTSDEFAKDPETWKGLLKSEFEALTTDTISLLDTAKSTLENLERKKNQAETLQKRLAGFEHLEKYKTAKAGLGPQAQQTVNAVEIKIRDYLSRGLLFNKKVTDKIKTGPWAGYLHAWLPRPYDDYRIVFSWNSKLKRVIFETIDRHKELGID